MSKDSHVTSQNAQLFPVREREKLRFSSSWKKFNFSTLFSDFSSRGSPGHYSRIFLVPKKNGKLRLIIDLTVLNHFVYTQTFKMETQRTVKDAVKLNDWAFSLDLTDAYLHIPIHHWSRKFLRFTL